MQKLLNEVNKLSFNSCLKELKYLINNTYNWYINRIEALIYMFGLTAKTDYNKAMQLLKNAMTIPVINSEV